MLILFLLLDLKVIYLLLIFLMQFLNLQMKVINNISLNLQLLMIVSQWFLLQANCLNAHFLDLAHSHILNSFFIIIFET